MDAAGIDVSVLTVNIPGPELLTPELGVEGARICNDYLAELSARYRGRFVGLATLPLQDVSAAMAEYQRAVHDLKLRGIFLFSHVAGKPLDAPEFEPLYAAAERDQIPLVLHPTVPTWAEVVKDYSMIPMVGLMMDTSIAMLRLILSGTLERHPNLLLVHPHCGGVLPYLMPRVEEQTEVKRRGREHIRKPPGDYYRNVYLDIVSPSAQAMQYAYDFSRPDRLLFGSDHPWVTIEAILEHFDRLTIPAEHKAMILGENARRLFRIG
jgi:predicted TIM-barrel fold metal-dependent hydrolase